MSVRRLEPVHIRDMEIWPPFTIPSGIITVTPDLIQRVAEEVPIGLITAKSVGIEPTDGYREPVFSQYSSDSLSTAIGLSNPGYEAWVEEIKGLYPLPGKCLLVSVFGDRIEDFIRVAEAVVPYADGIELNFCCPHSLQYGEALAYEGDLTVEITRSVRKAVSGPIVVKLSPNVSDIAAWAKALVKAGADAVAAIGPTTAVTVTDEHTGMPILSYGSGGLSGHAIFQRGVECIRAIRSTIDVPIIAGGGIRGAREVWAYREAGGNIFSVGTSLAGMDTPTLKTYFERLLQDLENGDNRAETLALNRWLLDYKAFRVVSVERHGETAVLRFDRGLSAQPGQFVFAWLPQAGEKPFSVATAQPLRLAVRRVGEVSGRLYALRPGDEVMIRGPFGTTLPVHKRPILVAGGCGAVPLRGLAEQLHDPLILLGGRSREDLLFREEFEQLGETVVATEDGSAGMMGTVVDALRRLALQRNLQGSAFYNCGPESMMIAAVALEEQLTSPDRILACVERHTVCGVGLCGKCAMDGYRTCVDGPCFSLVSLSRDTAFGRYRRGPSGLREPIDG